MLPTLSIRDVVLIGRLERTLHSGLCGLTGAGITDEAAAGRLLGGGAA